MRRGGPYEILRELSAVIEDGTLIDKGSYGHVNAGSSSGREAKSITIFRSTQTAMHPVVPAILLSLSFSAVTNCFAQEASSTDAPTSPLTYSSAEFGELRWLAGTWKGSAAEGEPFYEEYSFEDDSTLVITYHADSTFSRPTGSATVELRGGHVYHRSGRSVWVLVKADPEGLHFSPVHQAKNQFTWTRHTDEVWSASLSFPGQRPTVYRLERVDR